MYMYFFSQRCKAWTLPTASQHIVDNRSSDIARDITSHFPNNLQILGQASVQKSVVWHRLAACGAWVHLMADLLPPAEASAFRHFCELLTQIYAATSDASFVGGPAQTASDNDRKVRTQSLTLTAIKSLTLLETVLPLTRFTYLLHALIHLPQYIHRWNHVRNFWCFFMERYVLYACVFCTMYAQIVPNVCPMYPFISKTNGLLKGLCPMYAQSVPNVYPHWSFLHFLGSWPT